MDLNALQAIRVRLEDGICRLQLHRPQARNTINAQMVDECGQVLAMCEAERIGVVVIEGSPQVFCFGADFAGLRDDALQGRSDDDGAARIYDLWQTLATGPFVTVAHVEGHANAGGVGFVAACDIVIAGQGARFSLSELLFGLFPACVMPFLVRRVGQQRAHYLALSTAPIGADEAYRIGLVDRAAAQGEPELQRHLRRLRRLRPDSIAMYKHYMASLPAPLDQARATAIANNLGMHRLPGVVEGIMRYVETQRLPWEDD